MSGFLVPEEHDLAAALVEIAEKHGKFNEDETGIWAGYKPAKENEYKSIGVKCENCVLYRGGSECAIVAMAVEPEGKCRFAVIPDGVVDVSGARPGTDEDVSVSNYFQEPKEEIPPYVRDSVKEVEPIDIRTIEIDDLIPTQKTINMRRVGDVKENHKPIKVWERDGKLYLVDGHHRTVSELSRGRQEIVAKVYAIDLPQVATAGSKPAPKKDRIKGSDKNKKGSADTGKGVEFTAAITKALEKKVEDHNAKAKNGRKVNLRMLKAVYRRGAGAFSTSHRPDQNRNSWAMARVNAFLKLVRSGKPTNPKYTTDNDLLPKMHPRHSEASSMSPLLASLVSKLDEEVELPNEDSANCEVLGITCDQQCNCN